ncbi:SUMF1/EgtB/PvdO family nonheme iron enzyme [Thermopirellula anaerolimosa]
MLRGFARWITSAFAPRRWSQAIRVAVRWAMLGAAWGASWSCTIFGESPTRGSAGSPPVVPAKAASGLTVYRLRTTRLAVQDLIETYGEAYPNGRDYLTQLDALEKDVVDESVASQRLERLRREALVSNPLLRNLHILAVRRRSLDLSAPRPARDARYSANPGLEYGFPSNHECNSSLPKLGYDNAIVTFSADRDSKVEIVYAPDDGGYVGEIDLGFDGRHLLFTKSDAVNWKIYEMAADGSDLRQVSRMPDDVDCMDPCYLPDGRIVFGSTAGFQSVPCWHGRKLVTNLFVMSPDGREVRRLCYDQDHDFHPVVLPNGQVLYHRWDYTGINHIFMRQLMVMNPDGTGQRAVYGSNSWFPNALYFPRPLPGRSHQVVAILSGYHGPHRMGQLVVLDFTRGWYEEKGIVRRISGRGDSIRPIVRDNLVKDDWPKFLHPYPLSDKYFLVSCRPDAKSSWGIYLADVFDNLIPLLIDPEYGLFEPTPLRPREKPPTLPDRLDPSQNEAVVYVHDVYSGPGLAGVPRGTVKRLRIVAYDFGYPGLAGPDKIGWGGPWEVMRIVGTVPVEEDGSAIFRVPANTPLAIQPLDEEGKAVQWMRSWFTAMPGEKVSCVGCHEPPAETGNVRIAEAALREPRAIDFWYGPPRGLDFAREVQPVLDRYCVSCHDGTQAAPDLRREELRPDYRGRRISELGVQRLHPRMAEVTGGVLKYSPAYEALLPYVRRVGIEDDVRLLTPGEYHADTSPIFQLLKKGHGGVSLDAEAWDRLITWIDLNAPCHGTWSDVFPIPDGVHERRLAMRVATGGPAEDYENVPMVPRQDTTPVLPQVSPPPETPELDGWPFSPGEAVRRQAAHPNARVLMPLTEDVGIEMVYIPPGEFVMGDADGLPDERPLSVVRIEKSFWIGSREITNRQFRALFPSHDCGYYQKRHAAADDVGLYVNGDSQPVVRVSWVEAREFCRRLSQQWQVRVDLPTEAQWEYAARAGSDTAMWFGGVNDDFSPFANVGDYAFAYGCDPQVTGGVEHLIPEGALIADTRFDDRVIVTAPVGSYRPNPWGLWDIHGNAAEWTRSDYAPYPYREYDGRNDGTPAGRKVVRGGSFFDPPKRCRSAFRSAFPVWQRVFNVGFRIVLETDAVPIDATRGNSTR